MGKNKAQRTKNNARPSSSGRSAQLLETSSTSTFVGFQTLADGGFSLPVFAGLTGLQLDEGESQSVNPQLQIVLKKMNKKDAVTRLKALQEFAELCQEVEDEEIKAVLRFWPRMFGILATDPDHRVREATQKAHHQLSKRAKRNIAPHLRSLSGPWFVGQFDTFAPAASAASQSFQDAFPGPKYAEAIKYCQKEVLNYISENLLSQTVETVAYEKSLSAEELESRMERVLSSNLQGYKLYLMQLPSSELQQAIELNKALITSPKFWKLSKHKSPLVRRSWYSTLAALLHAAPFFLDDQGSQVVPAIFGNLDEADPSVLPAVWEATLHALVAVKDCWSHVNCEKVVFPKLWHILRDGGQGNAAAIYPNLLPLLSKITPQDKNVFYSKFFSNMLTGLNQKMVQQSSSESNAVVSAYMECFRYTVKKEDDKELLEKLLKEQMLSLVEKCVANRRFHLSLNPLATQVSTILQMWTSDSKLSNLVTLFWEHMTVVSTILTEQPNPEGAFQSFVEFIILLANPTKIKKSRKVNFVSCIDKTDEEAKSESDEDIKCLPYLEPLLNLAFQTAHQLLKACHATKYPDPYITSLLKLTKTFKSLKYFEALNGHSIEFFSKSLEPWLKNSDIASKPVVEIAFHLLQFLSAEDKDHVLFSLCKLESRTILHLCIEESIPAVKQGDQKIMEWLRSAQMHKILVRLAKEVSNVLGASDKDRSTAWSILKLCFSATYEGGLVIGTDTVSEILRVFCDALSLSSEKLKDNAALESCAKFVGELTNSLFSQQLKLCQVTLQELLLATFKLCCNRRGLSEVARESLQNAWKNGIQYLELSPTDMHKLCMQFSKFAHENFSHTNTQSVVCSAQFISVTKDQTITEIFLKLPLTYTQWQSQLENIVIVTDIVNNAYFWTKDEVKPTVMSMDCLFNYMNIILFNISLLQELSSLTPEEYSEVLTAKTLQDKLIEALYALCLCDIIINYYKNDPLCYSMMVDLEVLKLKLKTLVESLPKKQAENIMSHTLEQMKTGHHQWMWGLPHLLGWYPNVVEVILREFSSTTAETWENWKIWILQAVPSLTNYEAILSPLTVQISKHLSVESPVSATYMVLHDKNLPDDQLKLVFDLFVRWRNLEKWNSIFRDETLETSELVGVLKLFARTIKKRAEILVSQHWDSLLCSLACWLQEAKECVFEQPTNPEYAATMNALCYLTFSIQGHMNRIVENDELKTKGPKDLLQEWNSLFVPEYYSILMTFFYSANENKMVQLWEQFKFRMVGLCLARVPISWLVSHEPPKHLTKSFKRITVQQRNVEELCQYLCSLLHSTERVVQVTAYHLMTKLVPELVKKDDEYRLSEDCDSVNPSKMSCELLGIELSTTHTVVETMLIDFSIGDCCIVEPFTDSHLYTQAYLLTWGVMLDLCRAARSELRYYYARWLSNAGITNTMLDIVFRLMPDYVVHPFESKASVTPSKKMLEIFSFDYFPAFTGYYTASGIQQASCWIYKKSLLHLPALVRTWWSNGDIRIAGMVERLTTALVSPLVCAAEMKAVQDHEKNFSNMVVKVHQLVREVVAVYTVDEVQIELTITLPANHPLGPVRVEGSKPAIDIAKWKQWVMQLTIFLTHQNGSLWDGLMLWKRNLDTRFAGVDECCICYSVLHGTSYQIPKLSCHTCHKKFHSSCLYRWFHTSNNSTCPICRNLF